MSRVKYAYLTYIAGLLLFGSNGVVASRISMNSYEIVFLRSLFGTVALAGIFFLSGHFLTIKSHKRDAFYIVLSGIAMAADWLFLFEAYACIGVSLSLIINYCGPAIVIALSPAVFGERVTFRMVAGLAAAILGVVLISGGAVSGGVSMWGLLCAILSAFSYSAMVIFNKRSECVVGMENSLLQLFTTFLSVTLFTVLKQGFSISVPAGQWLPVLWLGVINTGGGCGLYFSSIGFLPTHSVAICGYLEPLSAVLLASFFLGERMSPLQCAGAVLILLGTLYGEGLLAKRK